MFCSLSKFIESYMSSSFVVVQSLRCVWLSEAPWNLASNALFVTIPQNLLKLMSIESVMLSNHITLCFHLLLPPAIFPSIRVYFSELALCIRWPKYWSFSFNISPSSEHQGWFSLRLMGLISLQSKGLFSIFSSTMIQNCQFFSAQPSWWSTSHIRTWLLENHSFNHTDFCQQI